MDSCGRASPRAALNNLVPIAVGAALLFCGCVDLKKPLLVEECNKAPGGCTEGWVPPRPDGGRDSAEDPVPDQQPADEPGKDVGPDNRVVPPDGPADVLQPGEDTRPPSDPLGEPPPDRKGDLAAEKTTGPEPGPEAGAEPGPEPGKEPGPEPGAEPGKEPGPEIGAEPGPEPGPEPRPEPGPEPGPEPPRDGGTDTTTGSCTIFYGNPPATGTVGHPTPTNSKEAFCVATCDDVQGWGCSNADDRTVTVNGASAKCGDAVAKKNGYVVFRVSAGNNTSAVIYWWGTYATSCPAPDGGVFP